MIGRSESTCVAAALLILCITAPLASPQRASGQDVAVVSLTQSSAEAVLSPVTVVTSGTVHVAPPTGDRDSDRANVQAAFDAVQPGGTVLFAPGTYLLGAGASLTVPDVTVLGHPGGTVLRGCDPEVFAVDTSESLSLVFGCTGLYVQAERQTVRGLTFEYTWHGIVVGPFPVSAEEAAALGERGESPPAYPAGGQRIEGNTFRATPNGLRVLGVGNDRSVVRDNDFIDVFHAIGISGAPLHFLDNRVTVAVPGGVPFSGHTGSAIIVTPGQRDCAGHVVAGNRIDGYPDPIYVRVRRGETCRGVEIRDNTIHAARVKVLEAWMGATPTAEDSTMVGAPITLMNRTESTPGPPETVMDALGIRRAILVGALAANQEMTWITEDHPERVAGLVYLAAPHVESDFRNPEIRAFVENYWRGSCDLGETAVSRIGPRVGWRPRFLDDQTFRIGIPALRFVWPSSASRSMDVRRLEQVPRLAAAEPSCDGEAASKEYFAALAADQERLTALRQALTESDRTLAMDSAMVRAFGPNLRTVVDPGGWDDIDDFVYPHIRRFLEEVARVEAKRPTGADSGSHRRE